PDATFLGLSPESTAAENANVKAAAVTLVTLGSGDQVGRVSAPTAINLTGAFSTLSTDEKRLLSLATAQDIVGVKHEMFEYSAGAWQEITTNFVTNLDRSTSQVVTVNTGNTVLVRYNESIFGLYRFLGANGSSVNLPAENFGNLARWKKLTATY